MDREAECKIPTNIPVLNRMDWKEPAPSMDTSGEKWIIVLGHDQLIPKAFYYAMELKKFGILTHFLSRDKSGFSRENIEQYGMYATITPKSLWKHWKLFLELVQKLDPRHIEIFFSERPWTLLFYAVVARSWGIPMLSWCRGGDILYWNSHHPIRRVAIRFTLRHSTVILLRELYMERIIREHKIADTHQLWLCYNSVPIPPEPPMMREPLVLFLNSFKPWRNPLLVVEAASIVVREFPKAYFELVGATSLLPSYNPAPNYVEEELINHIHMLGLEEKVKVLPFTNQPFKYFKRASVFLLPADVVFCNYSLLEAMAMGVVPIVADVEGARLIVDNGISGYVVPRNPKAIAERIIKLLKNQEIRQRMAVAARKKIEQDFNSARTARNLYELYHRKLWVQRD